MGFSLINPQISNQETEFSSNNETKHEAATEIWDSLSNVIKNFVPKFYFTIKDNVSEKMHHYVVKEEMDGDQVKYTLKEYDNKVDDSQIKEQLGGSVNFLNYGFDSDSDSDSDSNSDSDSDSSFSSDEIFKSKKNKKKCNNELLYPSLTYYPSIYGVPNVILPNFSSSFTPFVKISIPATPITFIP